MSDDAEGHIDCKCQSGSYEEKVSFCNEADKVPASPGKGSSQERDEVEKDIDTGA